MYCYPPSVSLKMYTSTCLEWKFPWAIMTTLDFSWTFHGSLNLHPLPAVSWTGTGQVDKNKMWLPRHMVRHFMVHYCCTHHYQQTWLIEHYCVDFFRNSQSNNQRQHCNLNHSLHSEVKGSVIGYKISHQTLIICLRRNGILRVTSTWFLWKKL